jgi:hypothetical protein
MFTGYEQFSSENSEVVEFLRMKVQTICKLEKFQQFSMKHQVNFKEQTNYEKLHKIKKSREYFRQILRSFSKVSVGHNSYKGENYGKLQNKI